MALSRLLLIPVRWSGRARESFYIKIIRNVIGKTRLRLDAIRLFRNIDRLMPRHDIGMNDCLRDMLVNAHTAAAGKVDSGCRTFAKFNRVVGSEISSTDELYSRFVLEVIPSPRRLREAHHSAGSKFFPMSFDGSKALRQ